MGGRLDDSELSSNVEPGETPFYCIFLVGYIFKLGQSTLHVDVSNANDCRPFQFIIVLLCAFA